MNSYKYSKIPEKYKDDKKVIITFFEVIKPVHWIDRALTKNIYEGMPEDLKVGSITWMAWDKGARDSFLKGKIDTLHIEGNRYFINFDKNCFQIMEHSIQKINR